MLLLLLNRVLRVLEGGPSERQHILGAGCEDWLGLKGYRKYVMVWAFLQPVFHYLGLLRAQRARRISCRILNLGVRRVQWSVS